MLLLCLYLYQQLKQSKMKQVYNIKDAANTVREMIAEANRFGSQYFIWILKEGDVSNGYVDEEVKVRVSDHAANAVNNKDSECISFILDGGWCGQQSNMDREYQIDEDGDFTEQFMNVEECLEWHYL